MCDVTERHLSVAVAAFSHSWATFEWKTGTRKSASVIKRTLSGLISIRWSRDAQFNAHYFLCVPLKVASETSARAVNASLAF